MRHLRALLAEAQVALMLLSRLPAGRLGGGGAPPPLARAAWAFPLVGALIGGLGAAVLGAGLALGLPANIAAVVALIATVLATGGLHEDGLADLADGFGGGKDAAHRLEIMRDSRIGSYGALALILSVLLRAAAMASVAAAAPMQAALGMIAIEAASRSALPVMMLRLPPARAAGMGHLAAGGSAARAGFALALGGLALTVFGPFAALVVVAGMAAVQLGLAALAMRKIGGQTGDVLGAAQQVSAAVGWAALSAL